MTDAHPTATSADIHQILRMLPHRYPFVLIDRVLECEPGKRLLGLKNVTINEPFFPGHFPIRPVMPGVLIMEALAQATAMLGFLSEPALARPNTLYYFAGMDNVRFKRPVEPGDQLHLDVTLNAVKRGLWMFSGEARVDGKVAATGDLMATIREVPA